MKCYNIIEEHRNILKDLCSNYREYCMDCPLPECNIDILSDSDVEKYYDSVFNVNSDYDRKIFLTKSQVDSLIVFIDCNFLSEIRADNTIDNMDYVCDICDIYRKLQKLSKSDSKSKETD